MIETKFTDLGVSARLLAELDRLGFVRPTPIQQLAIPRGNDGSDVVGIAQTGTGKTLAFGLPIIQRLTQKEARRALIMAPTRELALQIEETLQKLGRPLNLRSAVLIGGASMYRQVEQLRQQPKVIVATPGRLLDHLEQRTLSLNEIDIVVLDEADRMLDMGFAPTIIKILNRISPERQTMLFSATMPEQIETMAQRYMRKPHRLEVETSGTTASQIEQELHLVPQEEKGAKLQQLLYDTKGTVLVFARTRHGARKVARAIRAMGHDSAEIHSNRTLAQRKEALEGFKTGRYRVLVATDIASRGIDVKSIGLVVNYDLPDNPEDYVHRIGRTGRAGEDGRAITFATPDQAKDVREIEKLIRQEIPRAPGAADFARPMSPRQGGGHRPTARRPYGARPNAGPANTAFSNRRKKFETSRTPA